MGTISVKYEGEPSNIATMSVPVLHCVISIPYIICTDDGEDFYIVLSKHATTKYVHTPKEKVLYVIAPFIEWGVCDADKKRWQESLFDPNIFAMSQLLEQSNSAEFVFAYIQYKYYVDENV